jgi:hypothetical protein
MRKGLVVVFEGQRVLRECTVTICRSEELHGFPSEESAWVPFDPERLEPLEERLEKLRSRVEWDERLTKP